ncbi:hypothetical protein HMPREF9346_01387 [Escherichia coli MS 119-7]|nr:hypothetical protein HMPREF9346_01387 [Escherichia coli MS 119-7]
MVSLMPGAQSSDQFLPGCKSMDCYPMAYRHERHAYIPFLP